MAISPKVKSRLFIGAGSVSLGIGIAGIVLPLLPTTPFLLLAAYCYSRGSRRLHKRLLSNRLIGNYLKNYLEGKAMTIKAKVLSLSMLWAVIVCTAVFVIDSQIMRIIMLAVGAAVTVHIVRLRSLASSKMDCP